jgi:hypothetical protein
MKKLTIHKNKSETFHCQFKAEGAEPKDIVVRLCLEFDDNKNMFFYGDVNEAGNCTINIPQLNELKTKEGKLTIEAIADSMYFKLYEAEIEVKNSVEIKMETTLTKLESPVSHIQLETIYQEDEKPNKDVSVEKPVKKPVKEKPVKEKLANLKSFADWKRSKDKDSHISSKKFR